MIIEKIFLQMVYWVYLFIKS